MKQMFCQKSTSLNKNQNMPSCLHKAKLSVLKDYSDSLSEQVVKHKHSKNNQELLDIDWKASNLFQPWEAECFQTKPQNSTSPRNTASQSQNAKSKINTIRQGERLITIALKTSKHEIRKKEATSDFIHHTNLTNYIKEYRMNRHQLSDNDKRQGFQKVHKAYHDLSMSKSNQIINDLSRLNISYRSRRRRESKQSENECCEPGDNKSRDQEDVHPDRVRLPDIKESETMQQRRISTHMYMLDPTKMPKRSFPLFEDDREDGETTIRYRLSSFDKQLSGMKNKSTKDLKLNLNLSTNEFEVESIALPKINNIMSVPTTNCTRGNRMITKEQLKLPSISEETGFEQHDVIGDMGSNPASKRNSSSELFRKPKQSALFTNNRSDLSHSHNQSIREMLLATVTELQPFSNNNNCNSDEEVLHDDDKMSSAHLNSPKPRVEIKKESISYQIFRSLSHKPSMKALIEKFYTPIKEKSLGKNSSCVVSGKRFSKLPSLSTSCPHTHLSRRLNKRKITFEKYREQRLQAKENRINLKQKMSLEPQSNLADLAIVPKCETVVKSIATHRKVAV